MTFKTSLILFLLSVHSDLVLAMHLHHGLALKNHSKTFMPGTKVKPIAYKMFTLSNQKVLCFHLRVSESMLPYSMTTTKSKQGPKEHGGKRWQEVYVAM